MNLKDSNPADTEKHSMANNTGHEPAFIWWLKDVLRGQDRLIKNIKAVFVNRTHKFGIEIPNRVKESLVLDKKKVNTSGKIPLRSI